MFRTTVVVILAFTFVDSQHAQTFRGATQGAAIESVGSDALNTQVIVIGVAGGTGSVFPLAPPSMAAPAEARSAAPDCPRSRDPEAMSALLIAAHSKQANGEFASARAIVQGALTEMPEGLVLLNTLGSLEQDAGEYLAAEHTYLRALSTARRCAGGRQRMAILTNLATLYLESRQYPKIQRLSAEIEQSSRDISGAEPTEAAPLLNVLAGIQRMRHQYAEAERSYLRSIELWERAEGTHTANAGVVRGNLGVLYFDCGRLERADAVLNQAIADIQNTVGREHPLLIHGLLNLANFRYRMKRPEEAEPLARRAADLGARFRGVDHPDTAEAMLLEARALRQLRRKQEAKALERRATSALRKSAAVNLTGYTVDQRTLSKSGKP